jgi:hypothetical protein
MQLLTYAVLSGPLAGEASVTQKQSESSRSPEGESDRAFTVPILVSTNKE